MQYVDYLRELAEKDLEVIQKTRELGLDQKWILKAIERLKEKNETYGHSWCKRGGVGAFMMLARKWDRIDEALLTHGTFKAAVQANSGPDGTYDDIYDLWAYLLLVSAYRKSNNLSETQAWIVPEKEHTLEDTVNSVWESFEVVCKEANWDVFVFSLAINVYVCSLRRYLLMIMSEVR